MIHWRDKHTVERYVWNMELIVSILSQGVFTPVLFSLAELHEGLFSSLAGLDRCECNNCTQVCTNIIAEQVVSLSKERSDQTAGRAVHCWTQPAAGSFTGIFSDC